MEAPDGEMITFNDARTESTEDRIMSKEDEVAFCKQMH